ncbi:MAG: PIG-L family deacetylase [Terracidiphilus sp.]|nr:PIG-L family deacetylase [Terracidiphilus sp.]
MFTLRTASSLLAASLAFGALAQQAPPLAEPDPRMKADVLLVVAHPDDDVMIGGYLAYLALDCHKRVAVVFTTDGDSGSNHVASESGAALGAVRQIEARRALQVVGIDQVWFLSGHDTPGQNPLRSLDSWNHGHFLDSIVRLVRITRPDVILTWLPGSVAGENHGDHQASGVLAVEAFDAAGDPAWFPAQVSPPRDPNGLMNLTEGLLPWQPKKLYFFTDAFEVFSPYWHDPAVFSPFRPNLAEGTGPTFDATAISPSQHRSYAELMARQQAEYATQEGYLGSTALGSHDLTIFNYPEHLIFGKSHVGGSATGDVFDGVSTQPLHFVPAPQLSSQPAAGLTLEIGDPWAFYSNFWKAHSLNHLSKLLPQPELAATFSDPLQIPLRACNHTAQTAAVTLVSSLPPGWTNWTAYTSYAVPPSSCYPILVRLTAPASGKSEWQQLSWQATTGTQSTGSVTFRVYLGQNGGLPQ